MSVDVVAAPVGPGGWVRSVPRAVSLLVQRTIHHEHGRLGPPLLVENERNYVAFRETVSTAPRPPGTSPVVLLAMFRLRWMGAPGSIRHRLFRRVCVVTTPFFVGIDGFRSKLWMYDPWTGDYAGLYEWDGATTAQAYAEGLGVVLRWLSVPGSVSYVVVDGGGVDAYLAGRRRGADAPTGARAGGR